MRLAALAIALAALSAGVAACSSNSAGPADPQDSGAADGGNVVGCDDPKEETYSANMQQAGASSVFTFVLVSSDPAPPANDNNTWVVQLLDASGKPITDATFTAKATMPTMTHGTTPVTIMSNGDGTYTFTPLYFFMAGLWQVAITATSGAQKDTTSFYFCVAG
jgi:hypothetical protein